MAVDWQYDTVQYFHHKCTAQTRFINNKIHKVSERLDAKFVVNALLV